MEYRDAVAEGQRLVKQEGEIRFALGDLALEVAPMGDRGHDSGATEKLWRYAQDIGAEPGVLEQYRKVAAAWPKGTRVPFVSWSVHRELAARENRFELIRPGMTVNQAREARGAQPANYPKPEGLPVERKAEMARDLVAGLPAEHRAAIVRDAIEDEHTATAVMRDPHTRRVIGDARERIVEEIEGAARDREQASPVQRDLARVGLHAEIANDLSHARYRVAEATRKLQDFGDRPVDIEDAARRVRDILDWFEVVWRGGTADDEVLARLLDGEQ